MNAEENQGYYLPEEEDVATAVNPSVSAHSYSAVSRVGLQRTDLLVVDGTEGSVQGCKIAFRVSYKNMELTVQWAKGWTGDL